MKRKQFEPLEIDTFEADLYPFPRHSHTYYELIYIFKGCGNHHINQLVIPYKSGDLFLISPQDEHIFDIKKSTKFSFIKFNDAYFDQNKYLSPDHFHAVSPLEIMKNPLFKEEKLLFDEPCKTILRNTVENIIDYDRLNKVVDSPIVFYQILSLFGMIREASAKFFNIKLENSLVKKDDLASYIHQNIYHPELLKIGIISKEFNISETYFGAYFKRNFQISYRKYVSDYKLKLIERRIQSGQMTMKQIAYEFGFSDESHLTHYFKKQTNLNPSDFKFQNM